MPYITTERVKEIRNELKATFPGVKFSVVKHHHSTVSVSIMKGPYVWPGEPYQQLNPFYLERYEHAEFLQQVKDIANEGNYTVSHDGDYGAIPKFYVDIQIGKWDRPYEATA